MKKAFDQNVSRAKPRVRLGALPFAPEAPADAQGGDSSDLAAQIKDRAEKARAPKLPAAERVQLALDSPTSESPRAHAEPPREAVEVQTPGIPLPVPEELAPHARRERLKKRLEAVRENPRPEPLPATVAEAGVMAVERIEVLQAELSKLKALNLSLTQDLESARRTAERATEEARLRMEEARRLSTEMEARVKLLEDLERELSSLEGERDEALLSLQQTRHALEAGTQERINLQAEIDKREAALAESLSEEERLAGELEAAHEDASGLRRAVDALKQERDTLARQVSDLTRERAELLEARKALEAVHRALSHAVAR
ncbi:MAG: extensin-like protein [Myxococcota bacterium]